MQNTSQNLLSGNNSPRKKTEVGKSDFEKIIQEIMKRKDKEEKKSAEINSRNKHKILDNLVGSNSNTVTMVNNINQKNLSFINKTKNNIPAPSNAVHSPLVKKEAKVNSESKAQPVSKLSTYKKLAVANKSKIGLEGLNISKGINLSNVDFRRVLSPQKVNVDLNPYTYADEKGPMRYSNRKKLTTKRSENSELSRSFQNATDFISGINQTRNNYQNSHILNNLNCNSFDNDKISRTKQKDNLTSYYCHTEAEPISKRKQSNSFKKNNVLKTSMLNSSINLVKSNFKFLSENLAGEAICEYRKSIKDISTKAMTVQKNEIESIEDMHFAFVKFLRHSKQMEKLKGDTIVNSTTPESCKTMVIELPEEVELNIK